MIISEKNRPEICEYLFQGTEGVCFAKEDYNLAKHPNIDFPNLQGIMREDDVTLSDLEKKQEPGQGEDMEEEEEEYVMLDLEAIFGGFDVPPNTPYQLSDLDTMNPILTIGDKVKLIGEYEETVGTCLVFSETETAPAAHEESGPFKANLFTGTHIIDSTKEPTKQITPVASLHKILKFRLFIDNDDIQVANTTDETKALCS